VSERICCGTVLVIGAVVSLFFLGEYHGLVAEVGEERRDGDSARFDGKYLVELRVRKPAPELFAYLAHQADVYLVVQETVNLKDAAGFYHAIGKDFLFEEVHVENLYIFMTNA